MKSRSSSIASRARAGFTLLELSVAMGIGVMVGGLVLYGYLGANKAQSLVVCSNMMKVSGQATLAGLYADLGRARKLYPRSYNWLLSGHMPIEGFNGTTTPGIPTTGSTHVILPEVRADGSFAAFKKDSAGNQGATDTDFQRSAVGNALLFATEEPPIEVHDNATTFHSDLFGVETYRFTPYRFHFVFLARRPLPLKAKKIRGTDTYVYQLMHFTSATYLSEGEVEGWMSTLKSRSATSPDTFIDTKLTALKTGGGGKPKIAGAVNLAATTANKFFRNLTAATNHVDLTVPGTAPNFVEHSYNAAVKFDVRSSFGDSFVAFNTETPTSNAFVGVPLRSVSTPYKVPSFGDKDNEYPFGFETMIIGPPLGRQILMHLTLATRTTPGNIVLGEAFQQIATCQEH